MIPQHVVDQHAAAMRDTGLPIPIQKIVASAVSMSFAQFADSLDLVTKIGVTLTPAQVVEMARGMSGAWTQLKDTL